MATPFLSSCHHIVPSLCIPTHSVSPSLFDCGHCFLSWRKMERKIYLQWIPHDRIRLADNGEKREEVMKLGPSLPDEGVEFLCCPSSALFHVDWISYLVLALGDLAPQWEGEDTSLSGADIIKVLSMCAVAPLCSISPPILLAPIDQNNCRQLGSVKNRLTVLLDAVAGGASERSGQGRQWNHGCIILARME